MTTRLMTVQTVALAFLAVPVFAGNGNNYTYLALGDSIAFGYDPNVRPIPPATLPKPSQYTGYPEIVAGIEDPFTANQQVNAACPGETSTSFLSGVPPDNGCNGSGGFKAIVGLHASYTSYTESQIAFALSQLSANKQIKLITLGIGGDDLQLLEIACGGPSDPNFTLCVKGALPGVLVNLRGQSLFYPFATSSRSRL